jgi:hypothetical protein
MISLGREMLFSEPLPRDDRGERAGLVVEE